MPEDLKQLIRKQALTKGLILGLILIILSIISYYVITGATLSLIAIIALPALFAIILPIVAAIIFCGNLRKSIGGYWDFRQAVSGIFIMFFVAFLLNYVGYNVFFAKVIEPDMIDKTEASMTKAITRLSEGQASANQEAFDKKMEEMHKGFEEQRNISVGKQIQSVAVSAIFVFILALIFASIYKKERLRSFEDAPAV